MTEQEARSYWKVAYRFVRLDEFGHPVTSPPAGREQTMRLAEMASVQFGLAWVSMYDPMDDRWRRIRTYERGAVAPEVYSHVS